MCDTIVALGNSTQNGEVLFAKNSDRDPNEAHVLEWHAEQHNTAPAVLRCTYIEIPQVEKTNSVLLAKPFWIWGAEMGANQHGVVIGNEAVFTKIPHEKQPGLIGMDLLRLGLERGNTALEALNIITSLLKKYGQSGNCGFSHPFQYHNSFIIADPTEAWVLETAGREWAAEKVTSVRSISNAITIGSKFDLASDNLIKYAVDKGWCRSAEDFDFARCYSDFLYTTFGDAKTRHTCTTDWVTKRAGKLSLEDLIQALQQHPHAENLEWSPDNAVVGSDVCMHLGFGPIRINQTTGSMVSQIGTKDAIHWLSGTAAPCISLFKPVWMSAGLPDQGTPPTGKDTPTSLWWQHERLHRTILEDFSHRKAMLQGERDLLQKEMIETADRLSDYRVTDKLSFSESSFNTCLDFTKMWSSKLGNEPIKRRPAFYYRSTWKKINQEADFRI